MMEEGIIKDGKSILRHSPVELVEHWVLALSGLALLFSGFGELPMYKRFMITRIPGMAWTGDFIINLKIHYIASLFFISVMVFHGIYHGSLGHRGLIPVRGDLKRSVRTILSMIGFGEEPKAGKYLPEQRLAYVYLALTGLILVITGLVKVIKNLPGVYLSPELIKWMTLIHTFSTIFFLLGVLAHLAALLFKVNRPLVKSIFTGEVDAEYIRDRHTLWYEELRKRELALEKSSGTPVEAGVHDEAQFEKGVSSVEEVECPAGRQEELQRGEQTGGSEKKEETIMPTVLQVRGMSCNHCVMAVTKELNKLDGIQGVQVDLQKGEVRLENTKGLSPDQLEKAIVGAGFEVVKG